MILAADTHLWVVADEGVTAPLFIVFHTFQYEAMRADIADDAKYLDRGPHVSEDFLSNGHDCVGAARIGFDIFQGHHFQCYSLP